VKKPTLVDAYITRQGKNYQLELQLVGQTSTVGRVKNSEEGFYCKRSVYITPPSHGTFKIFNARKMEK
jgi:hypothetical protein